MLFFTTWLNQKLWIVSSVYCCYLYSSLFHNTLLRSYANCHRYWIEQIGANNDFDGSKPILIVGTHADQLTKHEQAERSAQMQQKYPMSTSQRTRQIHGHYVVSITPRIK